VTNPFLTETRENLVLIAAYVQDAIAKVDALAAQYEAGPPMPSYAEEIATASSPQAIYRAMERKLGPKGNDARTLVTRVERLVAAHKLHGKYPLGPRDLRLVRYVAEEMPDGRLRLQHALEALS
jgi:hypothetical protein